MEDDIRTQREMEGKSIFRTRSGLITPHEHNHLEPRDILTVWREDGRTDRSERVRGRQGGEGYYHIQAPFYPIPVRLFARGYPWRKSLRRCWF